MSSCWIFPLFNGDGVMNLENHLNQFLSICDIHSVIEGDVMVRVFLQTLVGPSYDCYLSLPTNLTTCFNDIEDAFLDRYSQAMEYHTLLVEFMQIHLQKNEKIYDFIIRFRYMLQKIPKDKQPNHLVSFGCFNNAMPTNVKYAIKASSITTLGEVMDKSYEREENILESNVDPELILGKVQRKM